jgi:hypothetical protein
MQFLFFPTKVLQKEFDWLDILPSETPAPFHTRKFPIKITGSGKAVD